MLRKDADIQPVPSWRPSKALHPQNRDFLTWRQQSERPVHLEIGCGQGLHPIQWAQQNPQARLLALERTYEKYQKCLSRLNNHPELTNLFVVRSEAQLWLPVHIQPKTLESLILLYPNPYPKASQANKRWHRQPFMGFLLNCLKVGGRVQVASNLPWYIEEAKESFKNVWQLELCEEKDIDASQGLGRTHFERKYLKRGEPCQELVFKRSARTLVFDGN